MPTQLAGDRRAGEGAERHADRRVEALDRLEHAEAGDLQEVVDRLATAGEAHRFATGEVEVQLDQLVAQPLVTGSMVLAKRLERLRSTQLPLVNVTPNRHLALIAFDVSGRSRRRPAPARRGRCTRHRVDPASLIDVGLDRRR